ncbi:MAG: hypothetical protein IPG32_03190 [Saprospirales bacterium]|nr:hypothetical protein [Saprospirales bacterium]
MAPDNVFVIPQQKKWPWRDGHIKLIPASKSGRFPSTDRYFFCSLAEKQKQRVIGIILSGSAGDGTNGMKDISCMVDSPLPRTIPPNF